MPQLVAVEEREMGIACPPWEASPNGVVSLLEMLQFYGKLFVQSLTKVIQWEVKCSRADPSIQVPPMIAVEIYSYVGVLALELMCHGLKSAAMKAGRIHDDLQNNRMVITYGNMTSFLRELRERIEDDFQALVFVGLSTDESILYEHPDKGWEDVTKRFSKVRNDIEEASKCFAFARYASAVFHVLLVAEFGIIKVAELFGVAGDKPGWGALDRLQKIHEKKWNDKSTLEQKNAEFLKNLLPLAFAIKDSWRHKINHVDNKLDWMDTDFSPEVAGEIISATRGFMRRLANDLPK